MKLSKTGSHGTWTLSLWPSKTRPASRPSCAQRANAAPDARDFFVNQATAEGIGNALTDEAARLLNEQGEFAIVTGALSAANQNEWIKFIRERIGRQHPHLKLDVI